jgi:hypothetical protein
VLTGGKHRFLREAQPVVDADHEAARILLRQAGQLVGGVGVADPSRVATASRTLVRVRSQASTSSRGTCRSWRPSSVAASRSRHHPGLGHLLDLEVALGEPAEVRGGIGVVRVRVREQPVEHRVLGHLGSSGSTCRSCTSASKVSAGSGLGGKPSGSPSEISSISCITSDSSSSTSYGLSWVVIMPRRRENFFMNAPGSATSLVGLVQGGPQPVLVHRRDVAFHRLPVPWDTMALPSWCTWSISFSAFFFG